MATDTLRPMRWVASLFALGLMMALFHRVTAGAPLEARATLALGFLLLVAYVGGEIARRVRLPRLTGYLLVGFAVGPAWLGLVQREEVDALRFIEEAAVALIGLAAGSEPDERDRRFFNKPERIHFFALHEAEPRGADGETHEQVARETRQPHAPRDLPADVRDEQKEAERQGRASFERSTRGHAMKKRHHQAQREQTRHPAHGPQSISRHALLTMRWSADIFR